MKYSSKKTTKKAEHRQMLIYYAHSPGHKVVHSMTGKTPEMQGDNLIEGNSTVIIANNFGAHTGLRQATCHVYVKCRTFNRTCQALPACTASAHTRWKLS